MERYVTVLAGSLISLGHSVTVHAHRTDPVLAESNGIALETLKVNRFPRKLQDFRYFNAINRVRPALDGLQIATSRVLARDAVICGGTHRGYLRHARKLPGLFDLLQIRMEQQAYRFANTVISHSRLCSGEIETLYGIPRSKIVTLYPPVDARFTPSTSQAQRLGFRKRFSLPEDKPVLLFPSTGHRRKGLKPICQALSEMPDPPILAVAGKPPGRSAHAFVVSLGHVTDMEAAYKAADFTILGSSYEPFGLVGVESILCGTRLLFDENIGCLEAIKPELVIGFNVRNQASIGAAILRAMDAVRQGNHHLDSPDDTLLYDHSPDKHARALLRAVGICEGA